ncbi:MAG: peroxide stress protein YaaA, partial [Actinobacteria bacterium]|nr:peroxide stress protein YaaA [Actinomycetota bacterium]
MHLLLPPSETKRSGGGSVFSAESLTHHDALGDARAAVRAALEALSADDELAAAALKLGAKSRAELAHNRSLGTSGVMPAIERYTGVLYDALDAQSLDAPARAWLDAHASIQSALFGLLGAGDPIP